MQANPPNASDFQLQQRPSFRPFNNYNNQAQPWRQQQAQRAYHSKVDKNKNLDPDANNYGNNFGDPEIPKEEYVNEEQPNENSSFEYYSQNKSAHNVERFFLRAPKSRARDAHCQRCDKKFSSRNKLHKHLHSCKIRSLVSPKAENDAIVIDLHFNNAKIVYSTTASKESYRLEFRSWHYAIVKDSIRSIQDNDTIDISKITTNYISKSEDVDNITPDFGCTMSVIDRKFLFNKTSYYVIKNSTQSIRVRGIEDAMVSLFEYIFLKLSLLGKLDASGKIVVEKIRRHVHVVDNLKANFLIESDILGPEQIIVDYKREILYVDSCREMRVSIKITPIKNKIKRVVRVFGTTVIPTRASAIILVRLRGKELLKNRDLMFTSAKSADRFDLDNGVLSHVIDVNLCAVQVNNILSQAVIVSKNSRLDIVYKYKEKGCYSASSKYSHLATDASAAKPDL